jgi:hypothetical protein
MVVDCVCEFVNVYAEKGKGVVGEENLWSGEKNE